MSTDTISKTAPPIKALPTIERLQELLDYDPATGVFRWKISSRRMRAGSVAGSVKNHGYRLVGVDGVKYMAHRLAWKMMTGSDPVDQIDHKNNTRDDNRFANLREATPSEQRKNATGSGSSKYLGVSWQTSARKWRSDIWVDGKHAYLGVFACEIEAARTYDASAKKHHGEFANLNFPGGS